MSNNKTKRKNSTNTTQKRTSGQTSKNKNTRTISKKKKQPKYYISNELTIISLIIIEILLALSNFGFCGTIGKFLSFTTFGLFGMINYIIPLILFGITIYLVVTEKKDVFIPKIVSLASLIFLICGLIQTIDAPVIDQKISLYYFNSASDKDGGGLIGGIIYKYLSSLIGGPLTIALIIISIIICIAIIMGRSIKEDIEEKEFVRSNMIKMNEQRIINSRNKSANRLHLSGLVINNEEKAKENVKEKTVNIKPEKEEKKQGAKILQFNTNQENKEKNKNNVIDIASKVKAREKEEKKDELKEEQKKENKTIEIKKEKVEEVKNIKNNLEYRYPEIGLLNKIEKIKNNNKEYLNETAEKLQQVLDDFGVRANVTDACVGPTVTRYEIQPEQGVKVSKIVALADDIKLNLAVADIRIEAPIPGKAAVGIEVPNKKTTMVSFEEIMSSDEFNDSTGKISFAVGRDIAGKVVVTDLSKMPHLLIAGATGSGKSVCINTIIMSLLYKYSPEEVRLMMIDPKVVELNVYNGIPHLLIPVITDPKKAASALNWAVKEMGDRYAKFAECGVRNIDGYNSYVEKYNKENEDKKEKMCRTVIIIDELADLMMIAPGDVEDAICRLAQLARAAGMHLIVATQRPSVNVITGLIKANIPSRIAFAVSSSIDSRIILDMNGAEKLLGKGDMLFYPYGYNKPLRIQGCFVSDEEVENVVQYLKENNSGEYKNEITNEINNASENKGGLSAEDRDELFCEVGEFIIEKEKASIGMIQRYFKVGFNRAARIMDQLAEAGVVGEENGTKAREILMTKEQFDDIF